MPGGFVRPITDKALREIRSWWPSIDAGRVEADWAQYQVRTQSPPATPVVIRSALEKIAAVSADLRLTLESLPEDAVDRLWDILHDTGHLEHLRQAPISLTILERAADRGRNQELGRDGRRLRGAKHQLFYCLRETLLQGGADPAHIKGHIARLAEILFEDADLEAPKDIGRAVREAFEGGEDPALGSR